jgi:hypothetical protein
MKTLPQPWFTGWIYDHLQPHTAALKVAHPPSRPPASSLQKGALASIFPGSYAHFLPKDSAE